jgi:cytoskeletal protein CcmA (bactofilin family)
MIFGSNSKQDDLPVMDQAPESKSSRPSAVPVTVIAKGVRIEGDFGGEGDMRIDGEVSGKITVGGILTVGPDASIKAEVKAGSLVVFGKIEGNTDVSERIDLKSTAKVKGDVKTQTLSIEPGASLHGALSVGASES